MKTYTVLDEQTGKRVTFSWEGEQPPTQADMQEVFAEARKQIQPTTPVEPQPTEQPFLRRAAQAVAPYTGPALEVGGALAGGALATPGSVLAPGLATIGGAGLGFATGRQLQTALEEYAGMREPATLPQALARTAAAIPTGMAMEAGGPILGRGMQAVGKILPTKTINKLIDSGIRKGIRPTVVGQKTRAQMQKYTQKAREAVKTIIGNRANLNLVDEVGRRTNKLPQTLDEFSQAVANTKQQVFREYDDLARRAGEKGAEIDLNKIADELAEALTGPRAKPLQNFKPEIVRKIESSIDTLRTTGKYTAEEAQEAIKIFNEGLTAFYKNPTYETASNVAIDSMIANHMRKQLDDIIEKTTRSGYQALKNQYAALKTIEKDINHRAGVDARKNIKGLIDFSDIFSGHQITEGLLSLNPAKLASGTVAKGIATLYRHINNPNTIINNMFSGVEKAMQALPKMRPQITPRGTAYGITRPGLERREELAEDKLAPIIGDLDTTREAMAAWPSAKSVQIGYQAYFDEDYPKAIAAFRQAIKEDPARAEIFKNAINTLMKERTALRKYQR